MEQTINDINLEIEYLVNKKNDLQRINQKKAQIDIKNMTKEQRITATWTLPALTDSLWKTIQETGFKTGSSVFSDAESNDLDFVVAVPPHVFEGYAVGMLDTGYWHNDGFTSLYAHYDGALINILCMSDSELMRAWHLTTDIMKQMQLRAYDTKWKRVRVFRALVDVLWPERQLKEPLSKEEAWEHHKCSLCGREAINFTCMAERQKYQATGICERCS